MTAQQGELDFDVAEGQRASPIGSTSPPIGASRTARYRRLTIIAAGSILFAALTTAMLVRLHASPAPADPAVDALARPSFPGEQGSNAQVFVAPKLSTIRAANAPTAAGLETSTISGAPLSMPIDGPNAQWRLPTRPADTGLVAQIPDNTRHDLLMVDSPQQANGETGRDESSIHAHRHNPHGLTLAAGSIIGCGLETAIDSSRGGYVTCVVTDDIVSDDAHAVLVERGTHVIGEYHSDARLGDSRIAIIWNRLRKSDGTTVDLASPGTDQQGRSGVTGAVDNHWFTRIGAAVLLSVIEDGISAASVPKPSGTTLVFSNTAATGSTLSQKVLDASINLPPTISVNPGARISILVAKDIDFQTTYANR